jgi:hypothetical protein
MTEPMQHIDLKAILQRKVSNRYGDLVTRPTGRAVRGGIEEELADRAEERAAVIDFGMVRLLDYSCADEIVGKLLLEHGTARYFVLQGVTASHCEAIEPVLQRHRLFALARDREGCVRVLGHLPDTARHALATLTSAAPETDGLPEATTHEMLEMLRLQGTARPSNGTEPAVG